MKCILEDYGDSPGPNIEVEIDQTSPNAISLKLSHKEDKEFVSEVYLDFFSNEVKVFLYNLDKEAKQEHEVWIKDEPVNEMLITDNWREHKPKE
jgi:hypothetical protein